MNSLTMYSDGGSRGNPGPSSCAAWFPALQMGVSEFIPEATNNEAEYRALILGLKWALSNGYDSVVARADSKIIVNQVSGVWRINFPHLQLLKDQVDELTVHLKAFEIMHIKRADNAEADRLCNECMDEAENKSDASGFYA
jgi:ribonuclease HI